eukprot:5417048-Amphidinium_carterae.2
MHVGLFCKVAEMVENGDAEAAELAVKALRPLSRQQKLHRARSLVDLFRNVVIQQGRRQATCIA